MGPLPFSPAPPVQTSHAASTLSTTSKPRTTQAPEDRRSRWVAPEHGETTHRVMIPPASWLGGFACRYHRERGLIDLRLHFCCDDGSAGWTPWVLGARGGEVFEVSCSSRPYAMGVMVRYQRSRGLVNLRLIRAGGRRTRWAVDNAGGEPRWAGLPTGVPVTGFELNVQAGCGIINLCVLGRPSEAGRD